VNAPSDPVRSSQPSPGGIPDGQTAVGHQAAAPAPKPKSTGDEERRKLTGRAGIVAAGTLFSRILGLLRDLVIAAAFTAKTTDAFFVAFTIPNVLRQLLAEGAVQNAALPVLEATKEQEGDPAARRAYASLRGLSLLVLTAVTILGIVFAPQLVELFATGYHRHEGQFERTVTLTRWLFPYIFFMGTAALGMAALNLHRRFVVTSFAPGLLNLAFIACSFALPGWLLATGRDPVLALAIGALLGGVLQVVAQWPSLRRIGYLTLPHLDFRNPKVLQVLRRMGPVLIGIGIYYLDVVLARRFLSELEVGSQSYFGWALRLCDFPQGIFVMALQTATLPSLSRLVARGEIEEVEKTFSFALRLTLFVGVTASVAAVALAEPLTILIFQRGHFDATSSHETARALSAQGLGIWMVAVVRQLVAVYYAFGDTRSPVRVAATDLVAFVILALVLRGPFGHVGISLAVSGASLVQMLLLAIGLRHRLPTFQLRPVLVSCGKTLFASGLAATAAFGAAHHCGQHFGSARNALALAMPGLISLLTFVCVFFGIAYAIRSEELEVLTAVLRRRRSRLATP
jgi:putative peptidoglycan lipid II flippase